MRAIVPFILAGALVLVIVSTVLAAVGVDGAGNVVLSFLAGIGGMLGSAALADRVGP